MASRSNLALPHSRWVIAVSLVAVTTAALRLPFAAQTPAADEDDDARDAN